MFSLRHMSLLSTIGCLSVVAVGLAAFAGLLMLRFQRRGAARFWAAPSALALCLLPLAVGAAFVPPLLRQVLAGMALTGSGGVAALAAGSAEALIPMQLGLGALIALAACAFLATAVGSSRSIADDSSGLAGWAMLAVSLGALAVLGGLVWWLSWTVSQINGPVPPDPDTLRTRLSLLTAGGIVSVAVTTALAIAAALLAPRGPSGLGMTLASLAAFAFCGVLSLAGAWATWTQSASLMNAAITGVRDGEMPEPVPQAISAEPSTEPMPPPPPPPAADRPAPEPERRTYREALEPSVPRREGGAVRVGGRIREPQKVKHVNPVYPELAKQARVQGVVILEATVSPRGDVTSVTVLRGIPLLDQAAIDAVKQWVYTPTLLDGVPVPVIMTVTVNYKLSAP